MIYIINKTAVFSSELKQLSLYLDNESHILLSNQAVRLFIELIQQNGITLSREHLLKHVWEDYGATPSNNNLYMAISELRKAFRNLGMTDKIITTIPKKGFLFEAEIDVSQDALVTSFEVSEPTETLKLSTETGKTHKKKHIFMPFMLTLTGLVLLVFLVSEVHVATRDPLRINVSHIIPQFSLGKCTFFALGKNDDKEQKWVTSFIQTDLVKSTLDIDCEKTRTTVYYSKMSPPVNEVFLTACTNNADTGPSKCKTLRDEND